MKSNKDAAQQSALKSDENEMTRDKVLWAGAILLTFGLMKGNCPQ